MIIEMLDRLIDTHENHGMKITHIELCGRFYQQLCVELLPMSNAADPRNIQETPAAFEVPKPSVYRGIELYQPLDYHTAIAVKVREP